MAPDYEILFRFKDERGDDASVMLNKVIGFDQIWPLGWSRGVRVEGIGTDAALVVLASGLAEAQAFIGTIGGRWSGYPVRARKVSP